MTETKAYTNEQAYIAYFQAEQDILAARNEIKALYKAGDLAATQARKTPGTLKEKLEAIREAWVPFREQIALLEAEIAANYEIADHNFDAWKGLK